MGLFHKVMDKLGRYRLIPDRRTGEDYMHRYYLFLKDRTWFPFNVTLHKIVKSDDPIFHDHPWPFMTIVLKGGYWEHTPVFNEQQRDWGFLINRTKTKNQWVQHDNYLNNYQDYHKKYIEPKTMSSRKKP
jgi:hypothetical protein